MPNQTERGGWTPGPWRYTSHLDGHLVRYYAVWANKLGMDGNIARTQHPADLDDEEVEANAALIAAAPMLESALTDLIDWLNFEVSAGYCEFCERHAAKDDAGNLIAEVPHTADCPYDRAIAALAAAKGEGQ